MLPNYISRISSPNGFVEAMEQTGEILLVANRHDIRLENDKLVLAKPPLKMYGITKERMISFTYSTVEVIPNDMLTAHIGVINVSPMLERIVLHIDQCFFTDLELPLEGEIIEKGYVELRPNLLNPEYKGLFVNIFYSPYCYSDNPVLLDDDELDGYEFLGAGHVLQRENFDLETIINTTMIQLGNKDPSYWMEYAEKCKKEYADKCEKEYTEEQRKNTMLPQKKQKKIGKVVKYFAAWFMIVNHNKKVRSRKPLINARVY